MRAYLKTSVFTYAGSACALGRLLHPSTPASDQLQPSVSAAITIAYTVRLDTALLGRGVDID